MCRIHTVCVITRTLQADLKVSMCMLQYFWRVHAVGKPIYSITVRSLSLYANNGQFQLVARWLLGMYNFIDMNWKSYNFLIAVICALKGVHQSIMTLHNIWYRLELSGGWGVPARQHRWFSCSRLDEKNKQTSSKFVYYSKPASKVFLCRPVT